ncbi:MAG TPA: hypothetical protein VEW65_00145 [Chryseolinea sp.]|nr:hypothetical protein [Chryseolinea sp.]
MKKKVNILLICVVVGVWGAIIYKVATRYFTPPSDSVTISANGNSRPVGIIERDTFVLKPLARDPFLNKSTNPPKRSPARRNAVSSKKQMPAIEIRWPSIKYFGYIKSGERKAAMILLKVDNKLHKARVGDIVDNVQVKKIYKDSIGVNFNKKSRTFHLEK